MTYNNKLCVETYTMKQVQTINRINIFKMSKKNKPNKYKFILSNLVKLSILIFIDSISLI